MTVKMASAAQQAYAKYLFRKVKLYYNTLSDLELVQRVRQDTGINLNALTADEAVTTIDHMKTQLGRQPGRDRFGRRI